MYGRRKRKLYIIIALVAVVASLSIGFAAFSATLNISSSASVNPSADTFSVKFSMSKSSLDVGPVETTAYSNGVIPTDGVIDNGINPTIKNLSATFTSPGQYVEYTFYARNGGEYIAYLNNINFLGNKICTGETGTTTSLVQSACESINITAIIGNAVYTETTPIKGRTLAKNTGEQIKIKLEYLESGTAVDGPFSIMFPNVAFVYSTIDDSSVPPSITKVVKLESGNLNDPGSVVSIGDEQFYVIGQEDENVKLLSMYNLYVGNMVVIDDNEERHGTPLLNPTGIQDKTAVGGLYENYKPKGLWIGTTAFSDIGPTYSGSIIEGYVNNYALYLSGLGVHIDEARLISDEELYSFGCEGLLCSDAPEWVYSTTYWTGSIDNMNCLRTVYSDKVFGNAQYYEAFEYGVRPVIEIPLSEF